MPNQSVGRSLACPSEGMRSLARSLLVAICYGGTIVSAHPVGHLHTGEQTHCAHDETAQHKGGVRDSGYFFSAQDYGPGDSRDAHGRRLSSTTWLPVRVSIEYTTTSALSSAQNTLLRNSLIPEAVAWIEHALSVQPLSANLLVERFCASSFSGGTCASLGATTCGLNTDGSSFTVPDSMLASKQTCSSCFTNGQCSGCTTHAAGTGAANTDFHLYVAAVQTSSCGSGGAGTAAYASTCQRDQYDRPILGHANFCPQMLDTATSAYAGQL